MSNNVYTSPDFQCDQTEGFPTSLCYDFDEEKVWLELNESLVADRDEMELNYYRQLCTDWGVRPCCTWDNFNDYLKELGDEAYENAAVLDEDMEMNL